jgi:predicted outer membrane repeat protein
MSSCRFINNTVGGFGGAVLATAASIFLDDSVFTDNYAGVAGDDVWLREASLIMSGVTSGDAMQAGSSSCELIAFDDSCDVFDEAIPEVTNCSVAPPHTYSKISAIACPTHYHYCCFPSTIRLYSLVLR